MDAFDGAIIINKDMKLYLQSLKNLVTEQVHHYGNYKAFF